MPKKDHIYIFVVFASLLCISFNITIYAHNRLATRVLGAQTEITADTDPLTALAEEKTFWEDVIQKHPTYRDAYIELSDIENKLGNTKRAKELLNLAYGIDPNLKN